MLIVLLLLLLLLLLLVPFRDLFKDVSSKLDADVDPTPLELDVIGVWLLEIAAWMPSWMGKLKGNEGYMLLI